MCYNGRTLYGALVIGEGDLLAARYTEMTSGRLPWKREKVYGFCGSGFVLSRLQSGVYLHRRRARIFCQSWFDECADALSRLPRGSQASGRWPQRREGRRWFARTRAAPVAYGDLRELRESGPGAVSAARGQASLLRRLLSIAERQPAHALVIVLLRAFRQPTAISCGLFLCLPAHFWQSRVKNLKVLGRTGPAWGAANFMLYCEGNFSHMPAQPEGPYIDIFQL